jgi:hypothetical protein
VDNNSTSTVTQPEETVQTTLTVPVDVWRAIKTRAMDERTSAQAIWIAAARAYMGLADPKIDKDA